MDKYLKYHLYTKRKLKKLFNDTFDNFLLSDTISHINIISLEIRFEYDIVDWELLYKRLTYKEVSLKNHLQYESNKILYALIISIMELDNDSDKDDLLKLINEVKK